MNNFANLTNITISLVDNANNGGLAYMIENNKVYFNNSKFEKIHSGNFGGLIFAV